MLLVSEQQFTVQKIGKLFSEFRRDFPDKHILQLEVLKDGPDELRYLTMLQIPALDSMRALMSYCNYPVMRSLRLRLAEVIAVDDDVVMRVHDGSRAIVRKVISGSDPLQFRFDDTSFEVVFLTPDIETPTRPRETRLEFYVVYQGPLRPAALSRASEAINKRFHYPAGSALFRRDSWFIGQPSYPPFNPFLSVGEMPSMDSFQNSDTGICRMGNGSVECHVEGEGRLPVGWPELPTLKSGPSSQR